MPAAVFPPFTRQGRVHPAACRTLSAPQSPVAAILHRSCHHYQNNSNHNGRIQDATGWQSNFSVSRKEQHFTATVTDSSGTPVNSLPVTFAFVNNNSGALALSVVSGTTDANGQAVAVYKAGATNPTADVQDTVSASVNSGGYQFHGSYRHHQNRNSKQFSAISLP